MGIRVKVSGIFFVFLAFLCLILPIGWIAAALTAGIFHELCHILLLRVTGGRNYDVKVGLTGTIIEADLQTPRQELFCALAGPVGSFLLLLLAEPFPKIALCGLVQGLYNLLPVYPLDGGRILSSGIRLLFHPETARKIFICTQGAFVFLILSAGLWAFLKLEWGFAPLWISILLVARAMKGKIPCKQGKQRVQ